MIIAVAGTGYVGISMASLLAQHRSVVAVEFILGMCLGGISDDLFVV